VTLNLTNIYRGLPPSQLPLPSAEELLEYYASVVGRPYPIPGWPVAVSFSLWRVRHASSNRSPFSGLIFLCYPSLRLLHRESPPAQLVVKHLPSGQVCTEMSSVLWRSGLSTKSERSKQARQARQNYSIAVSHTYKCTIWVVSC
jgi:hypothetical protein